MAKQPAGDVVNNAQSAASFEPVDVTATTTTTTANVPVTEGSSDENNLETLSDPPMQVKLTNGDIDQQPNPEHQPEIKSITLDSHGDSDTDGTRREGRSASMDPAQEDLPRRERANSVKRPAAFKSVSVTKNFLAKAGASTVPKSAASDKNSLSASAANVTPAMSLKPRLVAKSGINVRTPGGTPGLGSGGPDASKVWNRNQRKKEDGKMTSVDANMSFSCSSDSNQAVYG